jgi:hypothetical protein
MARERIEYFVLASMISLVVYYVLVLDLDRQVVVCAVMDILAVGIDPCAILI